MNTPACFDSHAQFVRWERAAARAGDAPALRRSGVCVDCTPEYQQRMKDEGRCEYPDVTFALDNDGQLCGSRS